MFRRFIRISISRRMRNIRQMLLVVLLMTTFMTFSSKLVTVTVQPELYLSGIDDFNMSSFLYPLEVNLRDLVEAKLRNDDIKIMPVNPHPFKFIHNQESCNFDRSSKAMNLLILIKSAAKNFIFRHTIRSTWGKLPEELFGHIRIVYMLGADDGIQTMVDHESKSFQDIIQENFVDAYQNNTYKTIMSFNWAVKYCRQADFLLFVDDDLFVNIPGMYRHLSSIPEYRKKDLLIGLLNTKEKPERHASSRWYVPVRSFPFPKYPPYLAGGAYATTISTVTKFHLAFPYVQSFWVDDVYLGIVAKKLKIAPEDDAKFHFQNMNVTLGKILVAHRQTHEPSDMVRVWKNNM